MSHFIPPPFEPPKVPPYATYIEDRRPKFKTHANRGQALNAVNYYGLSTKYRGGIIYRLVNNEWREVFVSSGNNKVAAENVDPSFPADA